VARQGDIDFENINKSKPAAIVKLTRWCIAVYDFKIPPDADHSDPHLIWKFLKKQRKLDKYWSRHGHAPIKTPRKAYNDAS
jgi:hypothetical protein